MFRIDHRVVRALLGALALYLVWHAVAPPFNDAGAPAQARMLMAFVAALLIAGLTASLYMATAAPGPHLVTPGPRMRAHRPRPWRSRMASAHVHEVHRADLVPDRSGATASSPSSSPLTTMATVRRGLPDHILVVCDGTSAGDSACRLAQRLADRRQAVVRAVAILPESVRDAHAAPGERGPIERFLDDVNEQMHRTTPVPAAWRLTLIVHDVEGELRRTCVEFDADTILVPASLRTPDGDVLQAASAAVANTPRVFGRAAPLIVVVAEESAHRNAPTQMHTASLRPDTAALAALSARPEPVTQP